MNTCNIVKDLLPLYVDGGLSADSREMVEEHMKTCPECQALEEGLLQNPAAIPTAPAARKSFSRFRRRMLLKRVLLISLCVILGLGALVVHFRVAIVDYIATPIPCRVDAVRAEAYRLSDGSVLVGLGYDGQDVYVTGHGFSVSPHQMPGRAVLTVYHDRWHDMEWRLTHPEAADWNSSTVHWMIFLTEESAALYVDDAMEPIVDEIVIRGEGGERLIWREGDELPPADEAGEEILKKQIADGGLTPRAAGDE